MLNSGNPDHTADALAGCNFPLELLEEPELQPKEIGGSAGRIATHRRVRDALFDYAAASPAAIRIAKNHLAGNPADRLTDERESHGREA